MSLIKLLSTDKNKYLYDAFENSIIEIDDHFYNILNDNNKLLPKFYLEKYDLRDLYEPVSLNIKYYYDKEELIWNINNMQRHLVLGITENCNMRCRYCGYYDERYYKKSLNKMTKDIAIKAIDLFLKSSQKNNTVIIGFYGGEPLLETKLIQSCIEYANNNHFGQDIVYTVSTNGLLLNEKHIVKFLVKNNCNLIVSLDGPQILHDRYRIDINGNGTYSKIKNNLKYIKNNYPEYFDNNVSFNSVITPPYEYELLYDFFENIPNNSNLIDVTMTKTFERYINEHNIPIYYSNTGSRKKLNIYNYDKMKMEYLKQMKKYKMILKTSKRKNNFPAGYCVPLSQKIYINSKGYIFFCERVDELDPFFSVGDVKSGIDCNKVERILEFVNNKISENDCKNCWALRFCTVCFVHCKISNSKNICYKVKLNIEKNLQEYLRLLKNNSRLLKLIDQVTI